MTEPTTEKPKRRYIHRRLGVPITDRSAYGRAYWKAFWAGLTEDERAQFRAKRRDKCQLAMRAWRAKLKERGPQRVRAGGPSLQTGRHLNDHES